MSSNNSTLEVNWAYAIILPCSSLLATVLNLATIYAFWKLPALHQKPSELLILNLSFTDLLTGMILLPLVSPLYITPDHWPFGEVGCQIAVLILNISLPASLFALISISTDRFLLVYMEYPKYIRMQSRFRIYLTIAACWIGAILTGTIEIALWGFATEHIKDDIRIDFTKHCLSPTRRMLPFSLTFFLTLYFLPIILVCSLSIAFLYCLHRRLLMTKSRNKPARVANVSQEVNTTDNVSQEDITPDDSISQSPMPSSKDEQHTINLNQIENGLIITSTTNQQTSAESSQNFQDSLMVPTPPASQQLNIIKHPKSGMVHERHSMSALRYDDFKLATLNHDDPNAVSINLRRSNSLPIKLSEQTHKLSISETLPMPSIQRTSSHPVELHQQQIQTLKHHDTETTICESQQFNPHEPTSVTTRPALNPRNKSREQHQIHNRRTRNKYIRPAATLVSLVLAMAICMLPYCIYVLVLDYLCMTCTPEAHTIYLLLLLQFSNAYIDPILYAVTNRKIRRFHRSILRKSARRCQTWIIRLTGHIRFCEHCIFFKHKANTADIELDGTSHITQSQT